MKFLENNTSKKSTDYLYILQIFRGFAALMVVVCHLAYSLRTYQNITNDCLKFVNSFGGYGVDFFFVLSGFIISYSVSQSNSPFKNYITNRILRIYTPFLPFSIFMIFFKTYVGQITNYSILRSLTLFPYGDDVIGLTWTLSFEMMFYILFGLSFISKRTWNFFIAGWATLIIFVNYISPPYMLKYYQSTLIMLSPFNLEFILGYLLSVIYIKKISINKIIQFTLIITPLLLSICLIYLNIHLFAMDSRLFFALFCFFLMYYALFNLKSIKKSKFVIFLLLIGDASYSIYIIHFPILKLVIEYFPVNNKIIYGAMLLLLFVFVIAVAIIYSWIFEKYVFNKAKKLIFTKLLK